MAEPDGTTRTHFNLTINHPAVFEQFFREFESGVKREIREAIEAEDLKTLREILVHLNIAIQNVDSVELLNSFRQRLGDVITTLATADDNLQFADDEDVDEGPGEPEEEDLVTYDDKHFYSVGSHSVFDIKLKRNCAFVVGDDEDRDEAIKAYMDKNNFSPNAWSISDHGNAHRIDLSEAKA